MPKKVCPYCRKEHNVKLKSEGFFENTYYCNSCRSDFPGDGTGEQVMKVAGFGLTLAGLLLGIPPSDS